MNEQRNTNALLLAILILLFFLTMYVRNALEHYGITTDLF